MWLTTGDRYTTDSGGESFHLHRYAVPGWVRVYASLNTSFREPVLVSSPQILEDLLLIRTPSISNTGNEGPVKNQIAAALVERIISAARSGTKFKVINQLRSCLEDL